jgi:hypothetical protein
MKREKDQGNYLEPFEIELAALTPGQKDIVDLIDNILSYASPEVEELTNSSVLDNLYYSAGNLGVSVHLLAYIELKHLPEEARIGYFQNLLGEPRGNTLTTLQKYLDLARAYNMPDNLWGD